MTKHNDYDLRNLGNQDSLSMYICCRACPGACIKHETGAKVLAKTRAPIFGIFERSLTMLIVWPETRDLLLVYC